MCGIVGLISGSSYGFAKDDIDVFKSLLVVNSLRGAQSTGAFGVRRTDFKTEFAKTVGSPYNFLYKEDTSKFLTRAFNDYKAMIGHGRFATKGNVSAKNAHPFFEDGLVLVHNGTIYNQKEIEDKIKESHDVDSAIITKAIKKLGIEETLELIQGAFALVFYDEQTKILNVVRNSERPLSVAFCPKEKKTVFASEEEAITFVTNRETRDVYNKVLDIAPSTLYQFFLDKDDWKDTKIKLRNKHVYYGHRVYSEHGDYDDVLGSPENFIRARQTHQNDQAGTHGYGAISRTISPEKPWSIKVGDVVDFLMVEGKISEKGKTPDEAKTSLSFTGTLAQKPEIRCWGNMEYQDELMEYQGSFEGKVVSIFPIQQKGQGHSQIGVILRECKIKENKEEKDTIKLANATISRNLYAELKVQGCISCGGELNVHSQMFQVFDSEAKGIICANCSAN